MVSVKAPRCLRGSRMLPMPSLHPRFSFYWMCPLPSAAVGFRGIDVAPFERAKRRGQPQHLASWWLLVCGVGRGKGTPPAPKELSTSR